MANVLVIGGSRGIGFETVRQALAAGHKVRCFARSAERLSLSGANLEKYSGDALKGSEVGHALDGIDTVIQAIGMPKGPGMVLGPVRIFSMSTRVLLSEMKAQGVRRLVAVTGFGAGDSRASISPLRRLPFHLVLGRAYADKDVQEQLVRNSSIDWVIVRPTALTNGARTGRYQVLEDPRNWRNGCISRADVADFLVQQIDSDAYIGKTPVLTC